MSIKCGCGGEMYKKETLNMSNVKYEVYECTTCGETKKICRGVMQ